MEKIKNTVFRVRKSLQIILNDFCLHFLFLFILILGYQESFANGAKWMLTSLRIKLFLQNRWSSVKSTQTAVGSWELKEHRPVENPFPHQCHHITINNVSIYFENHWAFNVADITMECHLLLWYDLKDCKGSLAHSDATTSHQLHEWRFVSMITVILLEVCVIKISLFKAAKVNMLCINVKNLH